MKKLITLLFILTLFFVTGCEEENKTLTLASGTYYDKNNMYNGESLEHITLKDEKVVERTTCGAEAGCSLFRGTYQIDLTTLKITLKEYNDVDGWMPLEEKEQEKLE